jgi:protease-4
MKKIMWITFLWALVLWGCGGPEIKLFTDATDALEEFTLEGDAREKILIIPVRGIISGSPDEGLLAVKPSVLQEVVSQLQKAERDKNVKGVILQICTLGGTVTASDILYHEIKGFRKRKDIKIVALLMDVATSGGYYIALPADLIIAHPTTVTGSVGVVFIQPDLTRLMEKIGLRVNVNKSGENKDMGAFFRETTPEEEAIIQQVVDKMGNRFVELVSKHREIGGEKLSRVASAQIMMADDAEKIGLVDRIGYMQDALDDIKKLGGLPENARVVVYRRSHYPDDNYYNPLTMNIGSKTFNLLDLSMDKTLGLLPPGFYHLWYQNQHK